MRKTFEKMPASRIALETGTHSPWVSRLLTELGHEAIVAHSRNVRLIGESRRKDDRLDAQALARLARIDPQLLSPIQHRSVQAQADLSVIRARYALVRARTALVCAARGLTKSFGERIRGRNPKGSALQQLKRLLTGFRVGVKAKQRQRERLPVTRAPALLRFQLRRGRSQFVAVSPNIPFSRSRRDLDDSEERPRLCGIQVVETSRTASQTGRLQS
jgi:transposase